MKTVLPRHRFMESMPRNKNAIYLTFDDGPDPDFTPDLLDTLKKEGLKATFFLIGEKAASHPEIVKRILDEGHAIGHHSFHHHMPNTVSSEELSRELSLTNEKFKEVSGKGSTLFRPPYGKLTPGKLLASWKQGLTICLWNRDSMDYSLESSEAMIRHLDQQKLDAGDVVLMHDNRPYAKEIVVHLAARAKESKLACEILSFG